jgi:hypothetical protein
MGPGANEWVEGGIIGNGGSILHMGIRCDECEVIADFDGAFYRFTMRVWRRLAAAGSEIR